MFWHWLAENSVQFIVSEALLAPGFDYVEVNIMSIAGGLS